MQLEYLINLQTPYSLTCYINHKCIRTITKPETSLKNRDSFLNLGTVVRYRM